MSVNLKDIKYADDTTLILSTCYFWSIRITKTRCDIKHMYIILFCKVIHSKVIHGGFKRDGRGKYTGNCILVTNEKITASVVDDC